MDLSHLHLQTTDIKRTREFYETHFEFSLDEICEETEIFLRNCENFVLGLEQVAEPDALPGWFHLGFDAKSETTLQETYARMKNSGVPITRELRDLGDRVFFYCSDPQGHRIEISWNRGKIQ
ncbi:MAG: VOC family protein [Bdellovibrionota bacterium]